jgi:hypothetical protein
MRFEDAVGHFDRIIALCAFERGGARQSRHRLDALKRYGEAISALDSAIAHEPAFAKYLCGARQSVFGAVAIRPRFSRLRQAWRLDPDLNYVEGFRLHAKMLVCGLVPLRRVNPPRCVAALWRASVPASRFRCWRFPIRRRTACLRAGIL